jgi:hypothetical protein
MGCEGAEGRLFVLSYEALIAVGIGAEYVGELTFQDETQAHTGARCQVLVKRLEKVERVDSAALKVTLENADAARNSSLASPAAVGKSAFQASPENRWRYCAVKRDGWASVETSNPHARRLTCTRAEHTGFRYLPWHFSRNGLTRTRT